jgi:hypothetical protein
MTNRDTYDILAYEEEKKQLESGINIQIGMLVDAMIESEKCLFHNSDANLMINSLASDEVASKTPFVLSGCHPAPQSSSSE